VLGWFPTVSQVLNTGIVVLFSYVSQRHFSFKSNGGSTS
jgi:putative flippase GtrA